MRYESNLDRIHSAACPQYAHVAQHLSAALYIYGHLLGYYQVTAICFSSAKIVGVSFPLDVENGGTVSLFRVCLSAALQLV